MAHPGPEDIRRGLLAQVGAFVVAIRIPGAAQEMAGSGLLVGPDLVLTCDHLVRGLHRGLFPAEPPDDHRRRLAGARLEIGLRPDGAGPAHVARLCTDFGRFGPDAWRAGPVPPKDGFTPQGDPLPPHDFAFLRLRDPVPGFPVFPATAAEPGAAWQALNNLYDRGRLAARGRLEGLQIAMLHFPVLADGTPGYRMGLATGHVARFGILPRDPTLQLRLADPGGLHLPATDLASSGAMAFARADGAFFPLGIHLGAADGLRHALALDHVKARVEEAGGDLAQTLRLSVPECHRRAYLHRQGDPAARTATALINRDHQADQIFAALQGGTRICPILAQEDDRPETFADRLRLVELPGAHGWQVEGHDGPGRQEQGQEGRRSLPVARLQATAWPLGHPPLPPAAIGGILTFDRERYESLRHPGNRLPQNLAQVIGDSAEALARSYVAQRPEAATARQSFLCLVDLALSQPSDAEDALELIRALDLHLPDTRAQTDIGAKGGAGGRADLVLVILRQTGDGAAGGPALARLRAALQAPFAMQPGGQPGGQPGPLLPGGLLPRLRGLIGRWVAGAATPPSHRVWNGRILPGPSRVTALCEMSPVGRAGMALWQGHMDRAFAPAESGAALAGAGLADPLLAQTGFGAQVDHIWQTAFPGAEHAQPVAQIHRALDGLIRAQVADFIERMVLK